MSELDGQLRELIQLNGPLNVAQYMGLALGHPTEGYYNRKDPFGVEGDFTTSPEISQLFGEMIGVFMAIWVILYGVVQARAPAILRSVARSEPELAASAKFWVGTLFVVPAGLAIAALLAGGPTLWLTVSVVVGLLIFGVLFAINSSLHSYLILAFTSAERVTMDVGFYYMANAVGRLIGTLLSGLTYQIGGLPLCLGTAAGLIVLSRAAIGRINRANAPSSPA